MNETIVVEIGVQAMLLAMKLAGPVLLVTLGIGVTVGLVQSVTQIQEPTLTFVPKFIGVGVVILIAGAWMLRQAVGFAEGLFELVPRLLSTLTPQVAQMMAQHWPW
ncbi:MAG: flagellar biosynthetic protein FliQ [Acidimicrobiia bacterium]